MSHSDAYSRLEDYLNETASVQLASSVSAGCGASAGCSGCRGKE